MRRAWVGVILSLSLVPLLAGAASATQSDQVAIRAALSQIKTVAGSNAWDRMQACGIRIETPYSSVSTRFLGLVVSLPAPPGQAGRITDISLRWARKNGSWTPDTGWADRLTLDPGRLDWMPC